MFAQWLFIIGKVVPCQQDLYIDEIEIELFLAEDVGEGDEIEWEIEAAGQE